MLEVLYVDLLAKENKQVPKLKLNKRSAAFVNKFKKKIKHKVYFSFFLWLCSFVSCNSRKFHLRSSSVLVAVKAV